MKKAFTLLELIVVIVILGILATLGFSQYTKMVESTRIAEAKARLGLLRQLAHQYYLENGAISGCPPDTYLGVDNTCTSDNYYSYSCSGSWVGAMNLRAQRCTSGGKIPNATTSYIFYMRYEPSTGFTEWHCTNEWNSQSSCFGYPY
jgi:type IV pilus assembly protein PilE